MRLTPSTLSKAATATSTLDGYLSTLKATHLKALARATGIPSSGRKDELRKRLGEELVSSVFLHDNKKTKNKKNSKDDAAARRKEFSILSIDMGIQNLAFAHLIVRNDSSSPLKLDEGNKEKGSVKLNAWHRIGVQELQQHGKSGLTQEEKGEGKDVLRGMLPAAAFRTFANNKIRKESEDSINEDEEDVSSAAKSNTFEPENLSQNAFILLSALLKAYNPTHILIERQRFRSGGHSSVLEWSLRVGVFEGMLHAVLRTMRELHSLRHDDNDGLEVYGVSPARVMQFWDGVKDGNEDGDESAQRNVKKLKIDVIGESLLLGQEQSSSSSPSSVPTTKSKKGSIGGASSLSWNVDIPAQNVQDVVDAYLRRWNGVVTRRKEGEHRIEKMDDLADCLLQGLTWLEWQARRASVVIEHGDGSTPTPTDQ